MKNIDRIERLEEELALLKAGIKAGQVYPIQEPIILNHPAISFEVYPDNLGKMSWKSAVKICDDLGDGWRLPTRLELLIMYDNKYEIGGFDDQLYWSSTEFGNNDAWIQDFLDGSQDIFDKDYPNFYMRAIRDIKK
tara:strand:+ start:2029 stop:2436 length:408 start_codon:yes stop_codon:yes gene_type:complete